MTSLLLALTLSGPAPKWDWNITFGTGQSLSVGGTALPIPAREPSFGNLKLDSGNLVWPVSADDPKLSLVPLAEPVGRRSVGFPSSWPQNIDGETYHASAASQVSVLAQKARKGEYVTVHYEVGEAGQGMVRIRKSPVREGVAGRAYEASMIATKAVVRLAKAQGKSVGVGAIYLTHGETDTGNGKYEEELYQLWSDYNVDLKAITGQKSDVPIITSQHNRLGDYSPSTIAQWKTGVDHPEAVICAGPKYQYPYSSDALHLNNDGYRMLGEKYGQVYFERVVMGRKWRPLEPIAVTRKGDEIKIRFHVPKGPLVWDTSLGEPHPSSIDWSNAKGFELVTASGKPVRIASAAIQGKDSVMLKLGGDPGAGARLSYALVGEPMMRKQPFNASPHWGLLRDSDPFVGAATQKPQPNFCVAFDWRLP